jgi:FkbM family methyltransferase|mmetsp:Transcript_64627/g.172339  ORF Transcript_64627/g.172339 Transcript_64627/m.172339 type:complete len:321 (+) Transcript_64627:45-1007(+)
MQWALAACAGFSEQSSRSTLESGAECFLKEYRNPRFNKGFRSRHSQFGEDLVLLPTLLSIAARETRSFAGRFVELGALDGTSISNTFLLERCFNWTGVLIEANPTNFAALKGSSRRATKVHSAIGPRGTSIMMRTAGGPTASQADASAWSISAAQQTNVSCRPLSLIMQETLPEPHTANLLSLDVEGAEAVVLATVDPASFDLIVVESAMGSGDSISAKDAQVDRLITSAGLKLAPAPLAVSASRVYVKHPSLVHPLRDTRANASAQDVKEGDGTPPIVRHRRYSQVWVPSSGLNASHFAQVLMDTLSMRGSQKQVLSEG